MTSRALCSLLRLAVLPWAAAAAAEDPGQRLLHAVNAARAAAGVPVLAESAPLATLAAEHSRAMAAAGRASHDGFADRFGRAAAALCVENVAQGHAQPEAAVRHWLRADPHRGNLLDPRLGQAGAAVQGPFVTWLACSRH